MVSAARQQKINKRRNSKRTKPIAIIGLSEHLFYDTTELCNIYKVKTAPSISYWPKSIGGGCGLLALNAVLNLYNLVHKTALVEVTRTVLLHRIVKLKKAGLVWAGDNKGVVVSITTLKSLLPFGWA